MPARSAQDALVRRTFAFVDLSGFTSLTDEDVNEAVRALAAFRSVVRQAAAWKGVRVAKWLGDGAMLVATEPRPLLDAVVEMENELDAAGCSLPLRVGVAGGRVLLFEGDDYVGRAVNLAARLCDEALPHQVLVTASLYDAVDHEGLPARRIGARRVPGFSRPVDLVDLNVEGSVLRATD